MRIASMLVFFFISSIIGCKNEGEKELPFQIKTFTLNDLDYPMDTIEIPKSRQKEFITNFFLPWNQSAQVLLDSLETLPGRDPSYLKEYLIDDGWYGENKKPHEKWQRQEIVDNVDFTSFPNFLKKGIVIAHTNLRRVPTHRPGFDTYSKAGEGYPFDYFQETGLWANTPLLLVHTTDDKQWCYVISPYYKGWVALRDVAIANEDFITKWSTENYGMPLSDKVNLHSPVSNYALNAKMGMVLPYEEMITKPNKVLVNYVSADENQNAHLLTAEVEKSEIALGNFKFSGNTLKHLVSNLIGRPYGWGGHLENRDCSSMIRDLLGTYKLWLPRDSGDQMAIGRRYDFPDGAEEKIKLIKEKGIPFLTILRKKGHNMLYVGNSPKGEPLILHAIWGLKTSYADTQLADLLDTYPIEGIHKDENGTLYGRHIIGEAVITTVTVGEGNRDITSPLDEIYAMSTILKD